MKQEGSTAVLISNAQDHFSKAEQIFLPFTLIYYKGEKHP